MKTIELTNETYADLLELKNVITMKTRTITNQKALGLIKLQNGIRKIDFEPEYSLDMCLSETIAKIWHEQNNGEVDFIT